MFTDGIDDAVVDMVLEDDPAHTGDGRMDGGQLDQDVAAVAAVFDHALDGFDVARNARQAVEDTLRFRMVMAVMEGMGRHAGRLFLVVVDEIGLVSLLDDFDEIEPVRIRWHDDQKPSADHFSSGHRSAAARAGRRGWR